MIEDDLYLLRSDIHTMNEALQRKLFLSFRQCIYKDIYYLLGEHALTEDAIQESFFKAIKNGPKTRADSNMTAWIRQIGRNTAYDFIRKNKKYRQMMDLETVNYNDGFTQMEVSAARVDDSVERKIRDESLYEAIRALKPDYRIVIYLHYILGMTYSEICTELHISEPVLTQRLARARRKLATGFSEKWGVWNE